MQSVEKIRKNIKRLADANPLSYRAISLKIGNNDSLINDIVTGRSRQPRESTLKKIAAFFDTDISALEHESSEAAAIAPDLDSLSLGDSVQVSTVRKDIIGTVAAGVWGPAEEWAPGDDRRESYPVVLEYPQYSAHTFLLRAEGQSMNLSFPDRAILVCVPLYAWDLAIEDGAIVVAEQCGSDGIHESTVKRLHKQKDGSYWLWPHSDHPDHQDPIRLPPPHKWPQNLEEANHDVFVSSVVVGAFVPLA